MKLFHISLLVLLCLAAGGNAADTDPELVKVPLKRAFIPVGFDDNDQVQLLVAGEFPDSCYKLGPYSMKKTERGIEVLQYAYRYKGMCLDIIVPFSQVVELGITRAANHSVIDVVSGKELGQIPVNKAKTSAIDDELYAPVSEAMILDERGGTGPTLYLTGNFPWPTMRMKEVRVQVYDDVVVVQPIAEITVEKLDAQGMARPRFEVKKPIKNLPKGQFLLHVRSMNGKAVNHLEELSAAR